LERKEGHGRFFREGKKKKKAALATGINFWPSRGQKKREKRKQVRGKKKVRKKRGRSIEIGKKKLVARTRDAKRQERKKKGNHDAVGGKKKKGPCCAIRRAAY